jgi:hypothetical protein
MVLYRQLLFTNRVLAGGDIQLYFYAYWDYVGATLRTGRLPFWNPYLFLGAPLLANPQSAVLYPLHWPLFAAGGVGLPVTSQLYWSAALHTWLLGLGGYALMRCWRYAFAPALLTGVVLAGSGFVGGLIGHINQLNVAAWLSWAALCLAGVRTHLETVCKAANSDAETQRGRETQRECWANPALPIHCEPLRLRDSASKAPSSNGLLPWNWSPILRRATAFGVLTVLMLLAGHTQSVFINLFALGVWIVWPWGRDSEGKRERRGEGEKGRATTSLHNSQSTIHNPQFRNFAFSLFPSLFVYFGGLTLGVLLAAPQLLPTLELSALGLRSGGLDYAEATSFSLKPLALGWTLLPSYGLVELGAIFDTPGYTEFVAYLGVIALLLALLGAWKGRGAARVFGLLFVGMGLFLALGRWNPLYFMLYQFMPGFDLFRAPARWMMLYTLGGAVLAGVGLAAVATTVTAWRPYARRIALTSLLIGLVAVELLVAARALPHTQPTAPQAVFAVRTAPAHLLTSPERDVAGAAAAGRFLGISTITYDPGDMADYRRVFVEEAPRQLDDAAFHDLVIAQKVQELLAPNLPLFWRVPAVDGFDGGVLPLQRYIRFAELLIPSDRLVPDGRLREQIGEMPDSRLLAMLNVAYVVTDKVSDLWFEDVFYDRQIGADLRRVSAPLVIETPLRFEATHVDLIGFVEGDTTPLAETVQTVAVLEVVDRRGDVQRAELTAGGGKGAHFADGALDSPMAARSGSVVAYRDVEGGRQEYRTRLALAAPTDVQELRITPAAAQVGLVVQAATLYDARTRMFAALLPSDRGRFRLEHSGDVKIYRNLDVLPRAYLAGEMAAVDDLEAALALLRNHAGVVTVVEGSLDGAQPAGPNDRAEIVEYSPERVRIRTQSAAPALLVLSDSHYPGWSATVDGQPAALKVVNGLFRGVVMPAGAHEIVFHFEPTSWRQGLWLAALGGLLLLAAVIGAASTARSKSSRSSPPA